MLRNQPLDLFLHRDELNPKSLRHGQEREFVREERDCERVEWKSSDDGRRKLHFGFARSFILSEKV